METATRLREVIFVRKIIEYIIIITPLGPLSGVRIQQAPGVRIPPLASKKVRRTFMHYLADALPPMGSTVDRPGACARYGMAFKDGAPLIASNLGGAEIRSIRHGSGPESLKKRRLYQARTSCPLLAELVRAQAPHRKHQR